jgi:hypothetical protein
MIHNPEIKRQKAGLLERITRELKRRGIAGFLSLSILLPSSFGSVKGETISQIDSVAKIVSIINDKRKEKEVAYKAFEDTQTLNNLPEVIKFFEQGGRFSIEGVKITATGYYSYSLDLKSITEELLALLFSKMGLEQVGTFAEIQETTKRRQKLRKNFEVARETIPAYETLKSSQYEVRASVSLLVKIKDLRRNLEIILGNLGLKNIVDFLSIFGSLRQIDVMAVIKIDVLNTDNNRKISLIAIGTPSSIEKFSQDIKIIYYRVRREKFDMKKDDEAILRSMASAINNLLTVIMEEKSKKPEEKQEKQKQEEEVSRDIYPILVINLENKESQV